MTGGVLMNASRQVAAGAAAAGSTIVVARTLGPTGAGAYAVAQAAIAVLTVATTFGIENGVIFRVAAGLWEAGDALRATLKVALVAGAIGAAIGIGSRILVPSAFDGLSVPMTAIALAVLPLALGTVFTTSCAVAIDRYEVYSLIPTLQAALVFSATAIGAWTFGLTGAVLGMTLAIALVAFGSIAWGLGLPLSEPDSEFPQLRAALRFGIASYGANALQIVNYRLDLFILSAVASSAAVGQYSVAVAVSSALWLLPRGLSDLLFPRVAQLGGPGGEKQRAVVEAKALRHATLIVISTAVVLAAAVELLMVPVFGEAFQPAISLTLILIPGIAFVALAGVLAASVTGRGKPAYGFYAAILTTPLTVALYVGLIPLLHATGAALASTISYSTSFVLYAWFYRRTSGNKVLPLLIPTRSEIDDLRALPRALAERVVKS
jgi:O-antigen/teichoic acid export membrane protein